MTLVILTSVSFQPLGPSALLPKGGASRTFTDRRGVPLNVSLDPQRQPQGAVRLDSIPPVLQAAVIEAEDKRFFEHHGIDWRAWIRALVSNIRAGRIVSGASTISEQTARLLHGRRRGVWSRWLSVWEALSLEKSLSKEEILEWYLNNIPYAGQRRGIGEAAAYYFNRELSTLSQHELIALAVLIRAPERLARPSNRTKLLSHIYNLAGRLKSKGVLSDLTPEAVLDFRQAPLPIRAGHFVQYLKQLPQEDRHANDRTTLDGDLQIAVQKRVRELLHRFSKHHIRHAAVLVTDNHNHEVLAWVNDRDFGVGTQGDQIDAVLMTRQPGSTLKPFVYAAALDKGWTAATIIQDTPLARSVGIGLHRYKNYSRTFHGPVRLRMALGSSLNVPAVRAAEFLGAEQVLGTLHGFGFHSLQEGSDFYGEGLALGNGEVSLLELVNGYRALARGGMFAPASVRISAHSEQARRAISPEAATIIGSILSDPYARTLEFGRGGILQFPNQTAIKTGTSSGYRDLWALGYSAQYTVGVWMGNLDRTPTRGLTSTQAPALLLRSIFATLERTWGSDLLPTWGETEWRAVSISEDGQETYQEIFKTQPMSILSDQQSALVSVTIPSHRMIVTRDPRAPRTAQKLKSTLSSIEGVRSVTWSVDNRVPVVVEHPPFGADLPLEVGEHAVTARIRRIVGDDVVSPTIVYFVK